MSRVCKIYVHERKKTRVEILQFESKKMRVELKKKNTRVEKQRTLTSCVVYRCLNFTDTRLRSKVVVCCLPNIADFFFSPGGPGGLIEDLEGSLVQLH